MLDQLEHMSKRKGSGVQAGPSRKRQRATAGELMSDSERSENAQAATSLMQRAMEMQADFDEDASSNQEEDEDSEREATQAELPPANGRIGAQLFEQTPGSLALIVSAFSRSFTSLREPSGSINSFETQSAGQHIEKSGEPSPSAGLHYFLPYEHTSKRSITNYGSH